MSDDLKKNKKKLGQLLIERKIITDEQLKAALKKQEESGDLLGQILVEEKLASEEAITQAITVQYGYPYLPLANYSIDREIAKSIPEDMAKKWCVVPIDRIKDVLTIAMADPLNEECLEELEKVTGCNIQVFVSTIGDIKQAISNSYK